MKYTKKFMVVPYVEEEQRTQINQEKNDLHLTEIIQSNYNTEDEKYRAYNEALKKILFKRFDTQKDASIDERNDNNQLMEISNEDNNRFENFENSRDKNEVKKKAKKVKIVKKDKIKKKSNKQDAKKIDKIFKKFDELDKTNKLLENKINQSTLDSSVYYDTKSNRRNIPKISTLKKQYTNTNQFSKPNVSPILENKKIADKRFSERFDPIELLASHMEASDINNQGNESIITADEEEEDRAINKKKRKLIRSPKFHGINNNVDSNNLFNWTHTK